MNDSELKYRMEAKALMGHVPNITKKLSKRTGVKYIAGRMVDRDELERMDEIYRGLRKYVDIKTGKVVLNDKKL